MPVVVQDNNSRFWIVDLDSGDRFALGGAGSGSLRAAMALYGEPLTRVTQLPASWRSRQQTFLNAEGLGQSTSIFLDQRIGFRDRGSAVDFFGGANGMERVVAGLTVDPFSGVTNPNPQQITSGSGVVFTPPTVEDTSTPPPPTTPNPQDIGPTEPDTPQTVDPVEAILLNSPWIPRELAEMYVDEWTATNDATLAWEKVRNSSLYEQFFPGNKREDGTFRYNEQQYTIVKDAFRQTLADQGLNPAVFESRFGALIGGDVSVAEFQQRVQGTFRSIIDTIPAAAQWYADNYGVDMTPEAILASILDPDVGQAVIERRLSATEIGAQASNFGFNVSASRADELRRRGLTGQAASQLYGTAATALPSLDRASNRFGSGEVDVADLEDVATGDTAEAQRLTRVGAQESSLFASQQSRTDREGSAVGLRER